MLPDPGTRMIQARKVHYPGAGRTRGGNGSEDLVYEDARAIEEGVDIPRSSLRSPSCTHGRKGANEHSDHLVKSEHFTL